MLLAQLLVMLLAQLPLTVSAAAAQVVAAEVVEEEAQVAQAGKAPVRQLAARQVAEVGKVQATGQSEPSAALPCPLRHLRRQVDSRLHPQPRSLLHRRCRRCRH